MLNAGSDTVGETQQANIFKAMARPEFYPHPVTAIEQRETHISKVFLTGDFVYKIKKPVDLGFLDYTTLEKRRYYCEQENYLNRRLSHNIYLGVVAITQKDRDFCLEGSGQVVEYAVKMRQLPEKRSLKKLLAERKIDRKTTEQLAQKLTEFYSEATTNDDINSFGKKTIIQKNCEENFRQLEKFSGKNIKKEVLSAMRVATLAFLKRKQVFFEKRIQTGKIRNCHGDLRCGHIYLEDDFQIIDCIEFNERFRFSDISSDLAFLMMDLDFEGFPRTARYLLDCYVRNANDPDLYVIIDFYKCYRALVRAKVNCIRSLDTALEQWQKRLLSRKINQYITLALQYTQSFMHPTLFIICGIVASGKSTIAIELSRKLGAKISQSDRIRKDLYGLQPNDFSEAPFAEGMYSKEAGTRVYDKLFSLARAELAEGKSVVLDATFSTREKREKALQFAKNMGIEVLFVECTAPEIVLTSRLLSREFRASLSDARINHFEHFKKEFESMEHIPSDKYFRINTQQPVLRNITDILAGMYRLRSNKITAVPQEQL